MRLTASEKELYEKYFPYFAACPWKQKNFSGLIILEMSLHTCTAY